MCVVTWVICWLMVEGHFSSAEYSLCNLCMYKLCPPGGWFCRKCSANVIFSRWMGAMWIKHIGVAVLCSSYVKNLNRVGSDIVTTRGTPLWVSCLSFCWGQARVMEGSLQTLFAIRISSCLGFSWKIPTLLPQCRSLRVHIQLCPALVSWCHGLGEGVVSVSFFTGGGSLQLCWMTCWISTS